MSGIDPAQVAAQITGCRKSAFNPYVASYCAEHHSDPAYWPCPIHEDATEVVRAALERAWDQGVEDEAEHRAGPNPYVKETADE